MTHTLTKQGYTEIVADYQAGNPEAFNNMVEYLKVAINKHTAKQYNRVKSYGYTLDEVYSLALEILWVTMDSYDGSRGADYLAYFSQRFQWHVNDNLISRKGSLGDKAIYTSVSFDDVVSDNAGGDSDGESSGIEYGLADSYELANNDSVMLKVDYDITYSKILMLYRNSAEGKPVHIKKAVEIDVEIIELVFQAVELNLVSKHDLNGYLYEQLPNRDHNTIRRNKSNAFKRFGEFLQNNI